MVTDEPVEVAQRGDGSSVQQRRRRDFHYEDDEFDDSYDLDSLLRSLDSSTSDYASDIEVLTVYTILVKKRAYFLNYPTLKMFHRKQTSFVLILVLLNELPQL